MNSIFVASRPHVSVAAALCDELAARFGATALVRGVEALPPGMEPARYLSGVLPGCSAQVVIVEPAWLTAVGARGVRWMDDPGDPLRLEIEGALGLGMPIIPVVVEGAAPPDGQQLPPSLRGLLASVPLPLRAGAEREGDLARVVRAVGRWLAPAGAGAWPSAAKPVQAPGAGIPAAPTSTADVQAGRAATTASPGSIGSMLRWALIAAGALIALSLTGALLQVSVIHTQMSPAEQRAYSIIGWSFFVIDVLVYFLTGMLAVRQGARSGAGVGALAGALSALVGGFFVAQAFTILQLQSHPQPTASPDVSIASATLAVFWIIGQVGGGAIAGAIGARVERGKRPKPQPAQAWAGPYGPR